MNTIFAHALWVSPLFWTLILLGAAIILFVHNKIRMDVVALLVMLSFYLSGILSIQEILVGFSDPNIILIALLFIVGESLVRTGIAYRVSDGILKVAGNSEAKVLILLMLSVAGLGAFMSSTGVVAAFIPVVIMICRQMNISPKRLMMPLSVAGLISGMMTLIATAPNLVVNAASAAFMTPVSSPVNTMMVGAGGYKFADFIKIGVPFTLIVMLVTVFIVPILFPF